MPKSFIASPRLPLQRIGRCTQTDVVATGSINTCGPKAGSAVPDEKAATRLSSSVASKCPMPTPRSQPLARPCKMSESDTSSAVIEPHFCRATAQRRCAAGLYNFLSPLRDDLGCEFAPSRPLTSGFVSRYRETSRSAERKAGNVSRSNQGFWRIHKVLRHDGCGSGKKPAVHGAASRTISVSV